MLSSLMKEEQSNKYKNWKIKKNTKEKNLQIVTASSNVQYS